MELTSIIIDGEEAMIRRYFGKWWTFTSFSLELGAAYCQFGVSPTNQQAWDFMEEADLLRLAPKVSPLQFICRPTLDKPTLIHGVIGSLFMIDNDGPVLVGRINDVGQFSSSRINELGLYEALDEFEEGRATKSLLRVFPS